MTFSAVLWDMDGTLVDTEPYWIEEENALMAEYGLTWTHEDTMAMVGNALPDSAAAMQDRGVPLESDAIIERLSAGVVRRLEGHAPMRPGVMPLLREMADRGVRLAIVTMSYSQVAEALVAALPEVDFEVVVSGDQVTRGKPDPMAYLRGAELLGLAPEDCASIEDSVTGLTAAVRAGTRAFGVRHLMDLAPTPGDPILLDTLDGVRLDDLIALDAQRS